MARGTPVRFRAFARGLNTASGPYSLQEGFADDPSGLGSECRDCLNVVSTTRGAVRTRGDFVALGRSALLAGPVSALSVDAVNRGTSASFLLIAASDGKLYSVLPSGVTTAIATGLAAKPCQFARLGPASAAYGGNGSTKFFANSAGTGAWTLSSSAVSSPNSVVPSLVATAGNRMWLAGDSTRPYSLFQTAINDPNVLDAEVQIAPDSGSPITGLGTVGPYLLVFTATDIYVVYDLESGANRRLTSAAGTLAPRSIVETPGGTYFLDPGRGVMVCDGASEPRQVSDKILPEIRAAATADPGTASGAWWQGHYYLSADKGLGLRYIWDFDSATVSWWRHQEAVSVMSIGAITTWDLGAGDLLFGAGTTNSYPVVGNYAMSAIQLFKSTNAGDGSTAATLGTSAFWASPYHTLGGEFLRKRIRNVRVQGAGSPTVYTALDWVPGNGTNQGQLVLASAAAGGSGNLGGAGRPTGSSTPAVATADLLTPVTGYCRALSLTFLGNTSAFWELDAYTIFTSGRTD